MSLPRRNQAPEPLEPLHRVDYIPLVAWALGFVVFSVFRAQHLIVPQDMSAYLAGADVVSRGLDPYADIGESALYQGFPYLYYPAYTLLLKILGLMPVWCVLLFDGFLRGVLGVYIVRVFARATRVPLPWNALVLGLLCLNSFVTDLFVGNLALFMCAIFAKVLADVLWGEPLSGRLKSDSILVGYGGAFGYVLMGALLVLKPFWVVPAAFVLMWRRRWLELLNLVVGVVCVLLVGVLVYGEQLHIWQQKIEAIRGFWDAFDLGSVSPTLWVIAALAWGLMGVKLIWKRHPEAWLWACAGVIVWPRIGMYSYLIVIPLLFWLMRRHGKGVGLVAMLPFSLLPGMIWPDAIVFRMGLTFCAVLGLASVWLLDDVEVLSE